MKEDYHPEVTALRSAILDAWNKAVDGSADFSADDVFYGVLDLVKDMIKATHNKKEISKRLGTAHRVLCFFFPDESLLHQIRAVLTGWFDAHEADERTGVVDSDPSIDALAQLSTALTELFAAIRTDEARAVSIDAFMATFPDAVANTRRQMEELQRQTNNMH